ncbi:MAG: hypothetical protein Ta2C_05880 [Candidatus Endomicrobiellum trichonymphae]|nr:MAG: hypothetical protein Ta2C_05880 [Candidatus Endomicrobium trichonymphae]
MRNCTKYFVRGGGDAVGRVTARPFIGTDGSYRRTVNMRDYSLTPVESTVLDKIKNSGGSVIAIGKIEDIFNAKGITEAVHTEGNLNGMKITLDKVKHPFEKQTLIFNNLVDFDMLWGHSRDSFNLCGRT